MSEQIESGSAEDLLGELLERNRRRRRARKWIGIFAIPLVLIAALLVVKLLSMYAFAHQSIRAFVATDFEGTVAAAEWQGVANWFEPYKAPYNRGTGLAEQGKLDEARTALEESMSLVSGLESCAVRYNLATVVERQGDRATGAGDVQAGQDLYRKALEILGLVPKECGTAAADASSPDHERPMKESLEELVRRIMEKLIQEPQSGNQNKDEPQDPPEQGEGDQESQPEKQESEPSDSQLDKLEKKLQDGAQQRQDREQGKSGDGFGSGTDKPW